VGPHRHDSTEELSILEMPGSRFTRFKPLSNVAHQPEIYSSPLPLLRQPTHPFHKDDRTSRGQKGKCAGLISPHLSYRFFAGFFADSQPTAVPGQTMPPFNFEEAVDSVPAARLILENEAFNFLQLSPLSLAPSGIPSLLLPMKVNFLASFRRRLSP